MAQWITITPEDLNDYVAAQLLVKLRTAALANGQTDPVERVIMDVCSRIRTEIRGNPTNRVSETAYTIPPELKPLAVALVIEKAYARLPGFELSENQQSAANNARKYLERIAYGKVPVSTPDDPEEPDDIQRSQRIERVKYRTNRINSQRLAQLN